MIPAVVDLNICEPVIHERAIVLKELISNRLMRLNKPIEISFFLPRIHELGFLASLEMNGLRFKKIGGR
jgi:hypothetical protein